MIAVWYEDETNSSPFGPGEFVAQLARHGVVVHRIDRPSETEVQLLFTPLDAPAVTALSANARAHTVIVVDQGTDDAAEEEAKRQSLGLCGLIDSSSWLRWRGGVFVAAGLYGKSEIATAAGLNSTPNGLKPTTGTLKLPELVARFLIAAERALGTK